MSRNARSNENGEFGENGDFGEFYSNSSERNQPGGIEEFSAFSLLHAFLNILVLVRNSMHLKRFLVHMNYKLAKTAITYIHIKIAQRDFLSFLCRDG